MTSLLRTRVQIPAYTDRWMMGDRFGEIVKVGKRFLARHHRSPRRNDDGPVEIATVKLDKSGKTVRVVLDDCQVLDGNHRSLALKPEAL